MLFSNKYSKVSHFILEQGSFTMSSMALGAVLLSSSAQAADSTVYHWGLDKDNNYNCMKCNKINPDTGVCDTVKATMPTPNKALVDCSKEYVLIDDSFNKNACENDHSWTPSQYHMQLNSANPCKQSASCPTPTGTWTQNVKDIQAPAKMTSSLGDKCKDGLLQNDCKISFTCDCKGYESMSATTSYCSGNPVINDCPKECEVGPE